MSNTTWNEKKIFFPHLSFLVTWQKIFPAHYKYVWKYSLFLVYFQRLLSKRQYTIYTYIQNKLVTMIQLSLLYSDDTIKKHVLISHVIIYLKVPLVSDYFFMYFVQCEFQFLSVCTPDHLFLIRFPIFNKLRINWN